MNVKNILIFNENEGDRRFLADLLLDEDFNVFETGRVLEALHILRENDISAVIASRGLNGVESRELREIVENSRPGLRVLFIGPTSDDYIPFDKAGFKGFLQGSLRVERALSMKVDELKEFAFSVTDRLLHLFEVNDRYFFNNDHLVANLSVQIARRLGLDRDNVDAIRFAALIKDIGKVGIQHKLFEENRRLAPDDFVPIKTHPLNTVQILKEIKFPWNVDSIIAQHHEHYDGSGYPSGLKGRQICIGARIISIADSYLAMTTDRPYRKALTHAESTHEIMKKAGTQFDPEIVEIFMEVLKEEPSLVSEKRAVMMLERQPNLTALIRLSINAIDTDVLHAASSFDAIRLARHRPPDLVIADVEMLDSNNFANFFNTLQSVPAIRGKPFILIVPDYGYPRDFRGDKIQYAAKPVDISELAASIRQTLDGKLPASDRKFKPTKGLSGTLEDFNLADIIQILNLGLKTAKVELYTGGDHSGTIYLRHGKVVGAETGELTGKKAFIEMIRWDSGTFQILHGVTTDNLNIKMDTTHLLLEAARTIDELPENRPTL